MKLILVFLNKVILSLLFLGLFSHTWAYSVPIEDRIGTWTAEPTDCHLTDLGNGIWQYDFTMVPKQRDHVGVYYTSSSIFYVAGAGRLNVTSNDALTNLAQGSMSTINVNPSSSVGIPTLMTNPAGFSTIYRINANEQTNPAVNVSYKGFFTETKVTGIYKNDLSYLASGHAYPGIRLQTISFTTNGKSSGYYNYWVTFTGNGECKLGSETGPTDPEPLPTLDPKFSLTNPNWSLKPVKLSDLGPAEIALNLYNSYNETLSSEQICIDYDKAAVNSLTKWRLSASSVNGKVTRNGTNLFTLLGPTVTSTGLNSKAYYAVELNPTDPNSGMKKQYFPQQTFYTESASDLTLPTSTSGTRNKACWTPKIHLFKGTEGSQETGLGLHNDNIVLLITPST